MINRKYLEMSVYTEIRIKYYRSFSASEINMDNQVLPHIKRAFELLSDSEVESSYDNISQRKLLSNKVRDYVLLKLSSESVKSAFDILKEQYFSFACKTIKSNAQYYHMYVDSISTNFLAEDIFIQLWEVKEKYDIQKSCFSTWFRRIIRNHILKKVSSQSKEELVDFEDETIQEKPPQMQGLVKKSVSDYLTPDVLMTNRIVAISLLNQLFKTTLIYPWKLLCYLLSLIGYKPNEVLNFSINRTLKEIFIEIKHYFIFESYIDTPVISNDFELFEAGLSCKLINVISPSDYRTLNKLEFCKNEVVGDLTFNTFLGKNPNHTITDWNYKVRRKLLDSWESEKAE